MLLIVLYICNPIHRNGSAKTKDKFLTEINAGADIKSYAKSVLQPDSSEMKLVRKEADAARKELGSFCFSPF